MNPSYSTPISPVMRSTHSLLFKAGVRLVAGLLVLASSASLHAAIVTWQGGVSSDWNTAANWNGGLATTSDTAALFSTALGSYTVNYSSAMTSGSISAVMLKQATGTGTVTLNVSANMILGLTGATGAALTVDRNAIVNVNSGGTITMIGMTGGNCGAIQYGGQLNINGGTVYTPATSSCYLGITNNSAVTVQNGGVYSGTNGTYGSSIRIGTTTSSTNASLTITGASSKILSRVLYVGRSGTGNAFNMQGGTVTLVGGGSPSLSLSVGSSGSWSGVATITGGTLTCSGNTIIGGDALNITAVNGTFNASASQSGGLWTQNASLYVGVVSAANGNNSMTVSGGTFNGQAIYVGHNGTSALTAGTSSLTINGGIFNATSLTVGDGSVTLAGGTAAFTGAATIGDGAATSTSVLNVNGGVNSIAGGVTVNAYSTLSGSGSLNAAVTVAGGTVGGNGLSIGATTLTGPATWSGTTTATSVNVQSGTTTVSGKAIASGTVSVQSGATLANNGNLQGFIDVRGLLKGAGSISGTVSLSGTLAPGNSPGAVTISNGDFKMLSTAKLVMEIESTSAFDQVRVTNGNVTLSGTLDLTSLSGLGLNDHITLIDVLDASATTTGYFTSILVSGSTYTFNEAIDSCKLSIGGTNYLLSYRVDADSDGAANDVTLTVVPEPNAWAMVAGGVAVLAGFQRLHRRGRVSSR